MEVHQGAARVDALRLGPVQERLEVAGAELLWLRGGGRRGVIYVHRIIDRSTISFIRIQKRKTRTHTRINNRTRRALEKGCAGLAVDLASCQSG